MSSEIKTIRAKAMPLRGNDIDTDRIIPARYLICVTFDGLGEEVFKDDRSQMKGDHPFDDKNFSDAKILVVNRNFGCGSSREHAPQAIKRWGIDAIIGESFAEIFFGNCIALGLPCLTASSDVVEKLQDELSNPNAGELEIDLDKEQVSSSSGNHKVSIDSGAKNQFISGQWDALGQLSAKANEIKEFTASLPYMNGFSG